MLESDDKYQEAKNMVEKLKGFYVHLIVYILVNAMLLVINTVTYSDGWWNIYPLLGWGIGLTAHAISVFGFGRFFSKEWEKRKIDEYLKKN